MKKFVSLILIACMSCLPAADFEVRAGYAAERDVEDEEFYELDDVDFDELDLSKLEQFGVSRSDVEAFYHSRRPPRHGPRPPRPPRHRSRRRSSSIGKTAAGVVAGALIAILIEEAIHHRDEKKRDAEVEVEDEAEAKRESKVKRKAKREAEVEREAESEAEVEAERGGNLYADMLQACKAGSLAEFKRKFNEYELTGDAVINNMALISIAAEHSSNASIIKFLLDEGADAGADGGRPLCAAAGNARADSVKLLLYAGADAAQTDERGRSALSYAAANYFDVSNRLEVIKVLIIAGANFNLRDKTGMSPWAYAVQSGAPEVVNYFLDKGADARLSNIYNLAKKNTRLNGTQALKRIESLNKRVKRKK
ncbi:MAG: ankyrin repeat domain-containing protein [Synergistaceae bacterium]|nr:ankyrin repeat domain-containing protein [Synergistaceae bacterium]